MERNKKVLIAAPVGGKKLYSMDMWSEWIRVQSHENYDVCLCMNGSSRETLTPQIEKYLINIPYVILYLKDSDRMTTIQKITFSREAIRRYAIEKKYDYIFFLDTDTIPAYKDTIERLMSWEKDFVSGLYFYKNSKVAVAIDEKTNTNVAFDKIEEAVLLNNLIKIWGCGFGCLLLSKKLFIKCEFDYSLFGEERTDDFGYCHLIDSKQIPRYLDPLILCKHIGEKEYIPVLNNYIRLKND